MAGKDVEEMNCEDDFCCDLSGFEANNRESAVLESDVPSVTKEEACWLGIDEAGRGPVLGPMVYGISYSPISRKDDLKELGFADSKTLTEEKRDELFKNLNGCSDHIGWMVHILSPNHISNSMLRRSKYNLNALSHDTAIGLIQRTLDKGVNLTEVYVDTVGPPEKYQDKLKKLFPQLDITVAKKADATYPIVSAASICAKVVRDHVVKRWKFTEGDLYREMPYGSGYPADPGTKSFLKDSFDPVFGFPQFVRFSWSTASNILDEKAVPVSWEDDDDDDETEKDDIKNVPAITSFFSASSKTSQTSAGHNRHQFFTARNLQTVSDL